MMTPQLPLSVRHIADQQPLHPFNQAKLTPFSQDDINAFWELWESYRHEFLSRYCLRWMDGNLEDAEDALSTAGLKALEYLSTHNVEIHNLKSWLKRLLYNHCMTIWRGHRRCVNFDLSTDTDDRPMAGNPVADVASASPEQTTLRSELQQVLQGAIDNLPSPLREPARLRFLSEMCHRDIALRLNLQPANVRKRIQHACALLRADLQDYCSDAPQSPISSRSRGSMKPAAAPASTADITVHYAALRLLHIRTTDGIDHHLAVALDELPIRLDQKLATLRAYVERHPGGWKKQLALADLLYQSGDWEAAISAYRQVLNKQLRCLHASMRLGSMLHGLQRHQEALSAYQQALSWVEQAATEHHLHGLSLTCQHRFQEAATAFKTASTFEPDNIAHHHALGSTLLQINQPLQALQAYDAVLNHHPDDPVALTYSYDALCTLKQWREAQQRIERALEIDPKNVLAMVRQVEYRLQQDLHNHDDRRDTGTLLRRALRLAPHAPELQALVVRMDRASGNSKNFTWAPGEESLS